MMFPRSKVLVFVLILVVVSAGKKDKQRRKKLPKSTDLDDAIEKLSERVVELEEKVGSSAGSNVHFFFHGDGDHDLMHSENDQHVHIDLHLDGHHSDDKGEHFHHEHIAFCRMSDSGVDGYILMVQADHERSANFQFHFDHLGDRNSDHMIHVHQYADVSDNCGKTGGHYNPFHEGIDVGDLGTFTSDQDGGLEKVWKNNTHLSLFGEYSIVGRSIKVHVEDGKVACCIIGWSPLTHDHDMNHSHDHDHSTHVHDHSAHDHDHSTHGHDHTAHDHDHSAHDHDHDHH